MYTLLDNVQNTRIPNYLINWFLGIYDKYIYKKNSVTKNVRENIASKTVMIRNKTHVWRHVTSYFDYFCKAGFAISTDNHFL